MEQIPHVALFCVEHIFLPFAVPQYVLPVVVQYLTDCNNQVSVRDWNRRLPCAIIQLLQSVKRFCKPNLKEGRAQNNL